MHDIDVDEIRSRIVKARNTRGAATDKVVTPSSARRSRRSAQKLRLTTTMLSLITRFGHVLLTPVVLVKFMWFMLRVVAGLVWFILCGIADLLIKNKKS